MLNIKIAGTNVGIFSEVCIVEHVHLYSETEVWSSGGGSFAGSSGSTIVIPAKVRSETKHFKKVRIAWSNGNKETLTFPGEVSAEKGDQLKMLFLSTGKQKNSTLIAVKNLDENLYWELASWHQAGLKNNGIKFWKTAIKTTIICWVLSSIFVGGSLTEIFWIGLISGVIMAAAVSLVSLIITSLENDKLYKSAIKSNI